MTQAILRDALAADHLDICALNRAEQQQTSAMDLPRLGELAALATYHRVACVDGRVVAFLLAMRRGADYVNDNFAWFGARYPDFIYIDRIVVSASHRGRGLGRLLYADLFDFARAGGIPRLVCEINISPPNDVSRQFHERQGFREAGTQWVAEGTRLVSLQRADTAARLR